MDRIINEKVRRRAGIERELCQSHTRSVTIGSRAFVLPNLVKRALSIRFSLPYAFLRP